MMVRRLIVFVLIGVALWPGIPTRADTGISQTGVGFSQQTEIDQPPISAPAAEGETVEVVSQTPSSQVDWLPQLSSQQSHRLVALGWLLIIISTYYYTMDIKKRSR